MLRRKLSPFCFWVELIPNEIKLLGQPQKSYYRQLHLNVAFGLFVPLLRTSILNFQPIIMNQKYFFNNLPINIIEAYVPTIRKIINPTVWILSFSVISAQNSFPHILTNLSKCTLIPYGGLAGYCPRVRHVYSERLNDLSNIFILQSTSSN